MGEAHSSRPRRQAPDRHTLNHKSFVQLQSTFGSKALLRFTSLEIFGRNEPGKRVHVLHVGVNVRQLGNPRVVGYEDCVSTGRQQLLGDRPRDGLALLIRRPTSQLVDKDLDPIGGVKRRIFFPAAGSAQDHTGPFEA